MSRIALCHFRVGETDGVSLEMAKWRAVLERIGHEVVYLAGSPGPAETIVIPELHYADAFNTKIVDNAYGRLTDYADEAALREAIETVGGSIGRQVARAVERHQLDVLVPNNIWSLGWNLPAGLGFLEAVEASGVRAVGHHHDFHWERERYARPTCGFVTEALQRAFPPALAGIRHVVINSLAREELRRRAGLAATIVPNVFDFDAAAWEPDSYNADLREALGIGEHDILLLQATRVVERKGIEMAIELAAELQRPEAKQRLAAGLWDGRSGDGRIVLLLAGMVECGADHLTALKRRAERLGVALVLAGDRVAAERGWWDGGKVYSLWDCYAHADLITYPSLLEGWGNQFLEALFARRPIALFEYPVFVADLLPHGFEVASLGSETAGADADGLHRAKPDRLRAAADTALRYLTDADYRELVTAANFERGRRLFGLQVLEPLLAGLVEKPNGAAITSP
ncbi:MAG: glycosyltransferase family 4 protein [Inquilinus sp.]|nr:glycosyltransferase family 4 protein [Inquilinus sp.]